MTQRMPRWLAVLGACALPLLAQAQSNCPTDANYILGMAGSDASAMHWPTGLVWKRCVEGETFSHGQCSITGAQSKTWNAWAETEHSLLPKSFTNQTTWGIDAGFSQNLLESGAWRMAYVNELLKITEDCGDNPNVNRTVFPDTLSSGVWSGSPYAANSDGAWDVYFYDGYAYGNFRSSLNPVRLVRGGQSFAALTSPEAQTAIAEATVTFDAFTLAPSVTAGEAWGGARIAGDESAEFDINGSDTWVKEAIVKSGDAIRVRFTAPATGDRTVTFTLRSGQTTGTLDDASNAGTEATAMQETTASFTANVPPVVNGACGSSHGPASATAPSANLCATGTATTVTGSSGQWHWGCNGSGGGSSTAANACTAPYAGQTLSISADPTTILVGGTSTLTASSSAGLPVTLSASGGACSLSGTTATGTTAGTCTLTASQAGTGDSGAERYLAATDATASITVTAPPPDPVNGACGSSHLGTFTSAPTTGLCNAGTAGSVTGSGPWNWTCSGSGGGSNASCSASLQTHAVTASASPAAGGTASCAPSPVPHGGNTTCTAVANTGSGYAFQKWTGACAGQGAQCTLSNVQADQASTAVFGYQIFVPEGPQTGEPVELTPPTENNWQITAASTATTDSVGTPPPANVSLPHGVVSLQLEMGTAGSSATVVLTYPEPLPAGTQYYKFGRTQANPTPHWYVFSGAVISGNTITLTLTDGGAGDDDLTANGVIVDPGGPALAAGDVAAIPTLSEWAMMLLAGIIGLLAFGHLNPRRHPA